MATWGFIIKVIKKYNFKTNVGTFMMNTSRLHVTKNVGKSTLPVWTLWLKELCPW